MFRAPCAHRQEVKIVLYSLWYLMFIGPCIIATAEEWKTNLLQPATRTPPNISRSKNCNTQRTENKKTDVVIHQQSHRLLKMDILMSETCWAHNNWNKITSDIKLVFRSSTTLKCLPHLFQYTTDILHWFEQWYERQFICVHRLAAERRACLCNPPVHHTSCL